jgi:hypothetical protein
VPAVSISAQFIYVVHKAGTDRIEVNVPHQFKKIDVLLAQYGLKAVLEQMAVSAVLSIIPEGIAIQ